MAVQRVQDQVGVSVKFTACRLTTLPVQPQDYRAALNRGCGLRGGRASLARSRWNERFPDLAEVQAPGVGGVGTQGFVYDLEDDVIVKAEFGDGFADEFYELTQR